MKKGSFGNIVDVWFKIHPRVKDNTQVFYFSPFLYSQSIWGHISLFICVSYENLCFIFSQFKKVFTYPLFNEWKNSLACLYFFESIKIDLGDAKPTMEQLPRKWCHGAASPGIKREPIWTVLL